MKKTMTFEEQFPSLKDNFSYRGQSPDVIQIEIKTLQECCLDKQRVKEALARRFFKYHRSNGETWEETQEIIRRESLLMAEEEMKELGLEDSQ